ncbi:hypothetical protein HCH52_03090 [Oscillospiraceae bacterium HV4-5-C5C]|nr:hypothetical protein [Oscillospiraceae bacterium HV4-5-C5C]
MNSTVGVRQEVSSLVNGMILLLSACSAYIRYKMDDSLRLPLTGDQTAAEAQVVQTENTKGTQAGGKNA